MLSYSAKLNPKDLHMGSIGEMNLKETGKWSFESLTDWRRNNCLLRARSLNLLKHRTISE